MLGALSDERTHLSFIIAADPSRGTHDHTYFTASDSRLPFSSPPTTRRATVEVFDPASTRDSDPLTNELRLFYNFQEAQI
jgi:hypothetical protein